MQGARKTSPPKNWQVLGNMSTDTGVIWGYNWREHSVLERVKDIRLWWQHPGLLKTVPFFTRCPRFINNDVPGHSQSVLLWRISDSSPHIRYVPTLLIQGTLKRVLTALVSSILAACTGGRGATVLCTLDGCGEWSRCLPYVRKHVLFYAWRQTEEGPVSSGPASHPLILYVHFLYPCRKDFPVSCHKHTWTGAKAHLPDEGLAIWTISQFQRHFPTSL